VRLSETPLDDADGLAGSGVSCPTVGDHRLASALHFSR